MKPQAPKVGDHQFLFTNTACAMRTAHPTEILSVDSRVHNGWLVTGNREMKGHNGKDNPMPTQFFLPDNPPTKFDHVRGWH